MPKSKAQAAATSRWEKKEYDKTLLRIRKDAAINLSVIRAYAYQRGESLNGFILRTVREAISSTEA